MPVPIHNMSNLRLEVEGAPAGLPNIWPDPDSKQGTYLLFPGVVQTAAEPFLTSDGTRYTLQASTTPGNTNALSSWQPVVPSSYLRIRYDVTAITAGHQLSVAVFYFKADHSNAGTGTTFTPTLLGAAGGVGTTYTQLVHQVPADAAYAWFYFLLKKSGATPDASAAVSWNRVHITYAATSAAVAGNFAFTEPITWQNILGPTHAIEINREALDLGVLSAVVHDAALDPATTPTLARGKKVRVQANLGGTWESLFEGAIEDADADYTRHPLGGYRTAITLSAVDNHSQLANTKQKAAWATISQLPRGMSFVAQVPWNVNGNISQVRNASNVKPYAYVDDAKLVDQIAITRDSNSGYAWISRNNVLCAYTKASLPTTTACTFSDVASALATREGYSACQSGWNKDEIINQLSLTFLRLTGGAGTVPTEEVEYGPYIDEASVSKNGPRAASYTIVGTASAEATVVADLAAAILASNKNASRKVSALTMPVLNARALKHATQLDLYDKVQVEFSSLINAAYRITSIKHTIETDRWKVDYGFATEGVAAAPR